MPGLLDPLTCLRRQFEPIKLNMRNFGIQRLPAGIDVVVGEIPFAVVENPSVAVGIPSAVAVVGIPSVVAVVENPFVVAAAGIPFAVVGGILAVLQTDRSVSVMWPI